MGKEQGRLHRATSSIDFNSYFFKFMTVITFLFQDSFCVDSHIGLTQINDVSELELAEIVLEEKRRSKKKAELPPSQKNGDSPLIRRLNKNCKRRLQSDSEDSS